MVWHFTEWTFFLLHIIVIDFSTERKKRAYYLCQIIVFMTSTLVAFNYTQSSYFKCLDFIVDFRTTANMEHNLLLTVQRRRLQSIGFE